MSGNGLKETLKRLKPNTSIPIFVDTKRKCVESLISALKKEHYIEVTKTFKQSCAIIVTDKVSEINILENPIQTKAKNIRAHARKIVPTGKGQLVITTSQGVVLQQEAIGNKVGGHIIAYIVTNGQN